MIATSQDVVHQQYQDRRHVMDRMKDYIEDTILEFLSDEIESQEPYLTSIELNGSWYAIFTINGKALLYDYLDIIQYGMEKLSEKDNWRQYL